MNIGERLRQLRLERQLTQQEVGNRLGVTKATVNRYETGEIDIKRTMAVQLGEIYGVDPSYIMGWSDTPTINHIAGNSQTSYNNQGVIEQINGAPVPKKNPITHLTTQEQDLLRIYNKANGKQQMKIMNFMYNMEDEIDGVL